MSSYRQDSIDRDSLFGESYSETSEVIAGPSTDATGQPIDSRLEASRDTNMVDEAQNDGPAGAAQQHESRSDNPTQLAGHDDPFNVDLSMFGDSNPAQTYLDNEDWLSNNNVPNLNNDHGLPGLESNPFFDDLQTQLQLSNNPIHTSGNSDFPGPAQNTNMPETSNQQTLTAISSQDNAGSSQLNLMGPPNRRRPRLLSDHELQQLEDLLPKMSITWARCLDRCRQAEFSPMAVRIRADRYEEHKTIMRQLHIELHEAIRNRLGISNPCTPAENARAAHFQDGIFTKARKCFQNASVDHVQFQAAGGWWHEDQYNYMIRIQYAAEMIIRGRPGELDVANWLAVMQLTAMKWQQEITQKWIDKLKRDTPRDSNDHDDDDGNDDNDNDNDDDNHGGDDGNGGEQPKLNRFQKPARSHYDSSEAEEVVPRGKPGRPSGAKNKTPAERAAAKAAKASRRRRRPATKSATRPEATATAAVAALSSSVPARNEPSQATQQRMAYNPFVGYDLPVNGPWQDHHLPPRGIPQRSGPALQPMAPTGTSFNTFIRQYESAPLLAGIGTEQGPLAHSRQATHPSQMSPPRSAPQRVLSTPTRTMDSVPTPTPQVKPSPRVKTPPSGKSERTYFR